MTTDSDEDARDENASLPIDNDAEIEFQHSVPFTDSLNAFQYDPAWLNSVARSLRASVDIVINNDRMEFTVLETGWFPTDRLEGGTSEETVPYSTRKHSKSVDAGPEADCEFIAILEKEGLEEILFSLRVAWNDAARPLLARYEGGDLPVDTSLETEGLYSPSNTRTVERIERVPPNEISADKGSSARGYLDETVVIQTAGPTSNVPLSDLDLSGPNENRPGEVPSLPDELEAIGRCPSCTSAVVRDVNKDRVVCVGCRRWCTNSEWANWHTTPGHE